MPAKPRSYDRLASGQADARAGSGRGWLSGAWHSQRVAYLKLMLPAVAVTIVALVMAWPQLVPNEKKFHLSAAKIAPEEAESLKMLNARLVGTDEKNQPYVVTAIMATQASAAANDVYLEMPKADITMTDGAWLASTAKNGVFTRDAQTLEMIGDVNLFHDNGTEFRTSRAKLNFQANEAVGYEPVEGQGPAGNITAEGFHILEGGARVLFTGKSHLVMRQKVGQ